MALLAKTEPKLDAPATADPALAETVAMPATVALAPAPAPAPVAAPEPLRMDQLSRIEDKVARVEEKFARAEERMMRVESALEKATLRLEGATQDMNMKAVNDDLAAIRAELRRKPGGVSIFVVTLVTALIAAAAGFALARFGIPGILPR